MRALIGCGRLIIHLACGCVGLALLASCTPASLFNDSAPRFFRADAYPTELSAWNLVKHTGTQLRLNPAAQSYDVNMPLFSDYASKYRTLWLPEHTSAARSDDGTLTLPVGSIISKSFLYGEGHAGTTQLTRLTGQALDIDRARLLETRLLVKQTTGWEGLTYLWNGTEAYLKRTGAVIPVALDADGTETFSYVVPSVNECASCHATDHHSGALQPIGLQMAQLSSAHNDSLQPLVERGWLRASADIPATYVAWEDRGDSTAHARAYLDSNCAHCHSDTGPAKNSGLDLRRTNNNPHALGVCKAPIAAGKGSGGRLYGIVPGAPDQSILSYRLAVTDPSRRMPEIGRSLIHAEGLQIVSQWIANLTGECR